jgi:hypothetical protein
MIKYSDGILKSEDIKKMNLNEIDFDRFSMGILQFYIYIHIKGLSY